MAIVLIVLLLHPIVLPLVSAGIAAPVELRIAALRCALVQAQEDNLVGVTLRAARDVLGILVYRLAWKNIVQDSMGTPAVHLSNLYVDTAFEAAPKVFDALHILGPKKRWKTIVRQRFLYPLRFVAVKYLLHGDQVQFARVRNEIPLHIRLRFRRLPHFELQISSRNLCLQSLLRNVCQLISIVGDYFEFLIAFLQVELFQSAPLFRPVDSLHGFEMIRSSCQIRQRQLAPVTLVHHSQLLPHLGNKGRNFLTPQAGLGAAKDILIFLIASDQ